MKEEIKNWLEQAKHDLKVAEYNLNGSFLDPAVFYCQQSAEKALKSVYIKKFKNLIRVHDLVLLARKIKAPLKIIELCKELNPAYQYTRYPDVAPVNDLKEKAVKFIDSVKEILKWAEENI